MFQDFYAQSDLLVWPVMALLIFVLIFVGVLAYVFLGLRDQDKIDEIASLPFVPESEFEGPDDDPAAAQADGLMDGRTR